jgi:hypothetical protein
MSDGTAENSAHEHHWLPWLAAFLLLAMPVVWFVVRVGPQWRAVRAIRAAGGDVEYAEPVAMARLPDWIRDKLPKDLFADVIGVGPWATAIADADLQHLMSLPQLQGLRLDGTKITDAGLERLKGLTQLQCLGIGDTEITDAGLEQLKGLTQLRVLYLHNTRITDAGLGHLNGLTQLLELDLDGTKITDAGLERLKGLTQLLALYIAGSKVTDAGVEDLKRTLPDVLVSRSGVRL